MISAGFVLSQRLRHIDISRRSDKDQLAARRSNEKMQDIPSLASRRSGISRKENANRDGAALMNLIFVKCSSGLQCHLDTCTAKVKSTFRGASLSELVSESSASRYQKGNERQRPTRRSRYLYGNRQEQMTPISIDWRPTMGRRCRCNTRPLDLQRISLCSPATCRLQWRPTKHVYHLHPARNNQSNTWR